MKAPAPEYRTVLLADDDADDRLLFRDALEEIRCPIHLQAVETGDELMHYLQTSAVLLPELLFLDLNMPGKTGFECLRQIRASQLLRDLFVIIYSTTTNQREIDEVFEQGADLFVSKPNSFTELKKMLEQLFSTDLKRLSSARQRENFVFNAFT